MSKKGKKKRPEPERHQHRYGGCRVEQGSWGPRAILQCAECGEDYHVPPLIRPIDGFPCECPHPVWGDRDSENVAKCLACGERERFSSRRERRSLAAHPHGIRCEYG